MLDFQAPSSSIRARFARMRLARGVARLREAAEWRIRSISRRRTVQRSRLGLDLVLDLRDDVQYVVYRQGCYEPNLSERIRRELRPGDVYVDIGAHIGVHALVAARHLERLGGGHVYAFEPTPDSAGRLMTAAERNRITNVTLVGAAVGEAPGRVELRSAKRRDDPGQRSAFGPGRVVGAFPMVRFDEWAVQAGLSRLDVVKVDVEGGELAALIGMRETLARLRPRLIVVEVAPKVLRRTGVTEQDLLAELARSGYTATEGIRDHGHVTNVAFAPLGHQRQQPVDVRDHAC
jgi:FkbM family methyltransferase